MKLILNYGEVFNLSKNYLTQYGFTKTNSCRSITRSKIKQIFKSKERQGNVKTTYDYFYEWDYEFVYRNNRRVSLYIGCMHFNGKNFAQLRRWATR